MPAASSKTRDATATKARLLVAATAEFAEHGLAGARVDRIAEQASANKRLIYAYFGNKEELFDAVVAQALDVLIESVPFTPEDLPGYAGALFDHLIMRPDVLRLGAWKNLERPDPSPAERASYKEKLAAIAAAQKAGRVDRSLAPADLLAIVLGIVMSWTSASGALREVAAGGSFSPRRLAAHRAAVVEAVARVASGA